mmetsp:Transcript_41838/g.63995  ORF Transcript_41838/g.63995 Transcript_41838/m.63995 type:complete len:86 (+) Transcript_41838:3690-3947(+)
MKLAKIEAQVADLVESKLSSSPAKQQPAGISPELLDQLATKDEVEGIIDQSNESLQNFEALMDMKFKGVDNLLGNLDQAFSQVKT